MGIGSNNRLKDLIKRNLTLITMGIGSNNRTVRF